MESTASVWEDPQCPFRVEWAPSQLNKMRILVVDAFYAVPRGGIEIGGVLLGHVEGKAMHIDGFVPMECEHLTGPSFVLSAKDEAALETQLTGLDGQAVGWFHSHTRSDIHFSAKDTELHNRFFPKPSQIAMVMRPENSQAPKANYFFRGPGGAMIGGTKVFPIEPIRSKPDSAAVRDPVPEPVMIPDPIPAARTVEVRVEVPPPSFLREVKPAPGPSYLWVSVVLLVAALGASAFFARDLWMPK